MRPLELTIEGFNSYCEPQTFAFDGRTLFGIVGPTGSGKSSILDGMIYALYGKTPRIERSTKMLINSGRDMARLELFFEAGGKTWRVTRALRRKGQSQVVLQDQDEQAPPITGEANVNQAVEELVGLDFRAFLSTVSLPQGEFDRFLHAPASDRSRILKGIFRLDRVDKIREETRRRVGEVQGNISVLEQQLSDLPADARERIEQLQADLRLALARQKEVNAALPEISRLESQAELAGAQLAEIERKMMEIDSILSTVPDPDALQVKSDAAETARYGFESATAELAAAITAVSQAEDALAEVRVSSGGPSWIDSVRGLLNERERLTTTELRFTEESKEHAKALTEAEKRWSAAQESLAAAKEKAADLQGRLKEMHGLHAAHLLKDQLEIGEPCPVCEQQISALPSQSDLPGLAEVEREYEEARAAEEAAVNRAGEHQVSVEVVRDRVRSLADQQNSITAALAKVSKALSEEVPDDVDPLEELEKRSARWRQMEEELSSARARREAAENQERQARSKLDGSRKELEGAIHALLRIAGALNLELDVSGDPALLPGAAKTAQDAGAHAKQALAAKAAEIRQNVEKAEVAVAEFRERFAALPTESAADVLSRISREVSSIELGIAGLEEAIARRKEATERISILVAEKARLDRIANDFTDARFTKYLLDGQRKVLSRLGSEKLQELTGHYRFDEEGEFNIVDTRTGTTRHPDTLSGGETFLASLALALALAEAVALEGGRLGCFFLDEGFGSLDPESLDLALDGIEKLQTPARVIGLISHVGGIQARLDDLIVLDRAPDGSTIVVQHEGPLGYAQAGL